MIKNALTIITLLALSQSASAQTRFVWQSRLLDNPVEITSEDLSESNGLLTYSASLERNQLMNLKLNLADVIDLGADQEKKLTVSLRGLSDVAPDCKSVKKSLSLSDPVSCLVKNNLVSQRIEEDARQPAPACHNSPRDIYETKRVCWKEPLKNTCTGIGGHRHSIGGHGGGDGGVDDTDGCPYKTVCEDREVKVGTVMDKVCKNTTYVVMFTVNGYDSLTSSKIRSFLTVKTAVKTVETKINGGAPKVDRINMSSLINNEKMVESDTYFTFVCEDGTPIGSVFNHPQNLHSLYYKDITTACGQGATIFLRSNRPLVFDTGEISISFERPN